MRFVFISDTHNQHSQIFIPDGDVLIHCGDGTGAGSTLEVTDFLSWFGSRMHAHKILIAGNHDWLYEKSPGYAEQLVHRFGPMHYLFESSVRVNDIRIWGAPWTPWFHDWAFNVERGPDIAKKWRLIPEDVDVLITHGPPQGILDTTKPGGLCLGCADLTARVRQLPKLRIHAFGHIHGGYGVRKQGEITFINASNCNEAYQAINAPIVIDL